MSSVATITGEDAELLDRLQAQTRHVLRESLGEDAPAEVALLDVPTHRNFGDSMIGAGTVRYLRDLGHRVGYAADVGRFRDDDLRRFAPDAAIILHGGGNLGDLWPTHERFRRHIVTTFPHRRIVLMPQSIQFQDERELQASVAAYRQASNLTILLREHQSMRVADEHLDGIDHRFCPDMALGMPVPAISLRRGSRPLVLARVDKEARPDDEQFAAGHDCVDWEAGQINQWCFNRLTWVKNKHHQLPVPVTDHVLPPVWPYNALRWLNCTAAVREVASAPWLVTNRLHAHVMAVLLGVPHVVTDNSYGKIAAVFDAYTGGFSTAHWADSLADAHTLAAARFDESNTSGREEG